ncbi:DUF2491 family protein [Azospirillum doebereinerae]|uniref:DUF2491 family protein n=1 Tax=Azospirillum doebereinerae TaxID=92933 RepID=A0A433J5K1_9PROT|nr:DUF2491 family protein [Azospirillum doebereinerae]RUQ67830.1 DUF2491 family protein [Azospirillum doebereinerae]
MTGRPPSSTPSPAIAKRLRAAAMAALLMLHPAGAPVPPLLTVVAATTAAAVSMAPGDASARASSSRSSSSGGYSRPSSSSSVRTPSTSSRSSSGGYDRPSPSRTPSTSPFSWGSSPSSGSSSGGYARPGASAPSVAAPPRSAGDQAISRQGSSNALNDYRARQDAARAPAQPAPSAQTAPQPAPRSNSGSSWSWGSGGGSGRTPSTRPAPAPSYPNAYRGYGWAPPPYAMSAPRRFGVWDGLFLWFMLDTLTRPSHAAFFHDNANDPGYRDWRAEADRQAKDNAELRAKLDQLDQTLAAQKDTPRAEGRLPPDIPTELARADSSSSIDSSSIDSSSAAAVAPDDAPAAKSSGFGLWVFVLLGIAVLFLLWRMRRRMDQKPGQPAAPKTANKAKGGSDVPLFGTLGNYVNQKLSGQRYSPSLFRLGMAVTVDPTPFLLAEGATKVKAPDTGTDRLVSIDGVGTVTSGNATVHRLHLPDGSFFQIHLGPDGQPDECRYFTPIDSVTPADADEWGFWLDEREGMIGWPEFQTKDGKLYPRVWSPGSGRIPPFDLSESLQTVRGTETVVSHAMLYGAPSGAKAPAPEYEYILVAAVERNGQASVEIAAGIDVNPASLALS